jgi:hypothetical protein
MDQPDPVRYPVGRLPRSSGPLDGPTLASHLAILDGAPARFRALVNGLGDEALNLRYRPGGWTVRQVVHHVPDSHLNAYVRMKLAMTEESPLVKTYDESRWAELPEAKSGSIDMSLALLDALHQRWVAFLRALSPADLRRVFRHPEWGTVPIDESILMYSWHCRHHAAHIESALRHEHR